MVAESKTSPFTDGEQPEITESQTTNGEGETCETDVEKTDADLSLNEAFDIVKNERRRLVLKYLAESEGPVALGDLAEHIAAIENDKDVVAINSSERKRVYVGLYQCHLPKMDAAIVMSAEMQAELPTDSHVIPHGVDLTLFEPRSQRRSRESVGWRHDAHQVLFPYPTSRPVKDYPRAERIVEAARERVDEPIVLQSLEYVPHETVPTYMNAADAMVLTSRREGSPNTVKEAMACNLPVVSTDVGDVRERLAEVQPSTVSDADEDLVDGLVDVLERGVDSNGREVAASLSLEAMAQEIRSVYESVV